MKRFPEYSAALKKMEAIAERERWSHFNPIEEKSIEDVLLKDQQFCVFQAAHAETAIKSSDGNPWIRVIGFTKTLDDARALARSAHDVGNRTETRIMPCGRNFLLGRKKYEGLDMDLRKAEQVKSNRLVDDHIAARILITTATPESIIKSREELIPNTPVVQETTIQTPILAHIEKVSDAVPRVMLQRYFAIAVVPDSDQVAREPSLVPLFAMDSEDEIREYLKSAAKSKDLVHLDIVVGESATWLPLFNPRGEKTLHHHPLRQDLENHIKFV